MAAMENARRAMVETQIAGRGITDKRVLAACAAVPRHEFVSEELRAIAYNDHPLPIAEGQTISQPYMVALMTAALGLTDNEKVLEIGTGSGYQAAILAACGATVYTVERIPALAQTAQATLERLGYRTVTVRTGDGTHGLPDKAPYNGIIVTAGAPAVPSSLTRQLVDKGRLVIPVGDSFNQTLLVITRDGDTFNRQEICGCVFVPLIGEEGWHL